jgi:hypothetical protein
VQSAFERARLAVGERRLVGFVREQLPDRNTDADLVRANGAP